MTRSWRTSLVAFVMLATLNGGCSPSASPPNAAPATSTPDPSGAPARIEYSTPALIGRIKEPGLKEGSGLVASRRNPGRLWAHNDSGDGPVLYCVSLEADGCGVWRVTGAMAIDWEDMAAGPGPAAGQAYLYIGDIGDNARKRQTIVVYRVAEPAAGDGRPDTDAAQPLRLRYPDGAHDAEALMVHPASADLYIVTKGEQPKVYKATAPVDTAGTTTLTHVTTLDSVGAGIPIDVVTGGDISPDGKRVALSTYVRGYEWVLPDDAMAFDDIWLQEPHDVQLGLRPQGESIAYRLDGNALLSSSEQSDAPLFQAERK